MFACPSFRELKKNRKIKECESTVPTLIGFTHVL